MANVLNTTTQSILRGINHPILGSIANPIQQGEGGFYADPSLLVHDTFTDVDGTALSAHTPDINLTGDTWDSVYSTNIKINASGQAYPTGGIDVLYMLDVGITDLQMECDFQSGGLGTSYVKLIARASRAVNVGWAAYMRSGEKTHLSEGVTNRVDGLTTHAGLVPHTMKFILQGNDLKIWYDDVLEISHTIVTTPSYGTYCGIMMSRTDTWMDNLKITAL
jgi:hypothetical protein